MKLKQFLQNVSSFVIGNAMRKVMGGVLLGLMVLLFASHLGYAQEAKWLNEASAETNIDQPASYLDEALDEAAVPVPAQSQLWLSQINAARSRGRQCGSTYYQPAQPVTWNTRLYAAANRHSKDMATHNFLSHTGSDGSSPAGRIRQAGYTPSSWGENIAAGYSNISAVVSAWLKSPGHCANIMNPRFRHIGAAGATNLQARYRYYWTLVLASPRQ